MNKNEFISKYAEVMEITKKDADKYITNYHEFLMSTLESGESVKFSGFGAYDVVEKAEREGRNPQTGNSIHIEAKKAPRFKFGKEFKDRVAGKA